MLYGPRRIILIAAFLMAIPIIPSSGRADAALRVTPTSAGTSRLPTTEQPPLAKRGDRSPTVKKMQQLLLQAGVIVRGGADGIFGPGTEAAVNEFQTRRGLAANGTLDAPTAVVLGLLPATPILSRGARGEAVRVVQQQLVTVGLTLSGGVDGVFGTATVATLKTFQRSKNLAVSGAVDAATSAILANAAAALAPPPTTAPPTTVPPTTAPPPTAPPPTAPPPPTTTPPPTSPPNVVLLTRGSRGEDVKTMQRQLISVGITVFGGADGVFGAATEAALKVFQTRVGLPATGVFDTVTKAALTAAATAPTTPPPSSPPGTVVLAAFPTAPTCRFTSTYGAPRSGGRKHEGVDIMVGAGTPLYAVVNGRISKKQVTFTGSLGGNALWLTAADGTYFFYAHLSAFAAGIEVGTVVTAGALIGFVGATGNASVPHLHFEVHPGGGAAVDPYPIVKAASTCK